MSVLIIDDSEEKTDKLTTVLREASIEHFCAPSLHMGIGLLQCNMGINVVFIDGWLPDGYSYAGEVFFRGQLYPSLIVALLEDPEPHLPRRLCAISDIPICRDRAVAQGCDHELDPCDPAFGENALWYVRSPKLSLPAAVLAFDDRVSWRN